MSRTVKLSLFSVLLVFSVLLLTSPGIHAAVTGKISGVVTDSETGEPLPGVNVIVEGTVLGAATGAAGEYFIIGVTPGVYSVSASIIGYQKIEMQDVRVMSGRTTTADFKMKSQALEAGEEVTVTAERPVIIKDLTATATHVANEVFESAPVQDTRDLINLNPGILRDTDNNIYIRGGEANQLKFYVDGVSMEQMDNRSMGMRDVLTMQTAKYQFNLLGVQEMEVITGGFNAEYGDAQSGIVNIITKEGGGNFHGDVRVEYSPPGKYHFGPYIYDDTYYTHRYKWKDFNEWINWNNTRNDPTQWADSLAGWYQKWKQIAYPTEGHRGGIYDYRDLTYKRGLWGVGGPIHGNKVTFFFSGELRSKPSLAPSPMKYFEYVNTNFNLTWRITPKMKLKYNVYYTRYQHQDWYNEMNLVSNAMSITTYGGMAFQVRFFTYVEDMNVGQSLTFTHTLSANTFYEVLVSYIRDQQYGMEADSGAPLSRDWWIPNIDPVGTYVYFYANNYSENSTDSNRDNYRYRIDLTSQLDAHNQLKAGTEGRVYNGYKFQSHRGLNYANASWNSSAYFLTPRYFSGYVQDKMEYGGMIANLGVRADYYDANKPAPEDKYNPGYIIGGNTIRGNLNTVDNKTYLKVSPRIGFSHPVGENTAFHFQYGHFYQAPAVDYVNNYGTYGGGYQYYPNVNLEPGKTVSYEFGLQHNIRDTHRINLVAYFNDLNSQASTKRINMPIVGQSTDRYFCNFWDAIGYGTSKGFEFTLDRTAIGKWYYRLSYTLARVYTGTQGPNEEYSTDPNDPRNWVARKDARTFLRSIDRTHRITGILSFRAPRDWGKLWGEWDISSDIMVQSGRPYTYTTTYEESISLNNNKRFPFDTQVDLTIKKWIPAPKVRPQVYLRITNLLNNRWVRPVSGNDLKYWIERGEEFTDLWSSRNISHSFSWIYNESRRMYLGVGFNF